MPETKMKISPAEFWIRAVNPSKPHIRPKSFGGVLCGDRTPMIKSRDMTAEEAEKLPPGVCVGCKNKWKLMRVTT